VARMSAIMLVGIILAATILTLISLAGMVA